MNPNEAVTFIETRLEQPLNDTQRALLRGVVQGKSYKEIHHQFPSCSLEHLSRNVGPSLWRIIGRALGEDVKKNTVIGAIERAIAAYPVTSNPVTSSPITSSPTTGNPVTSPSPVASHDWFKEIASNKLETEHLAALDPELDPDLDSDFESFEMESGEFDSVEFDSTEQPSGFPSSSPVHQSWVEAPDVSGFCGRYQELEELEQRIRLDHCRLLVLYGVAGIGKSLLASQLARRVRDHFESLVWMSMRAQPPLPLEHCLAELMTRLTNDSPADSSNDLLPHLFQHECLIILDGFETLLRSGVHDGSYAAGYEAYRELLEQLGRTVHRSCIIVTTRELPIHIRLGETRDRHSFTYPLVGLKPLEGQELLESYQLYAEESSSWLQFVQLCEGNPLILQAAAEQSDVMFSGNATEALNHLQPLMLPEVQRLYSEQVQRLSSGETWVLRSLFSHQPHPVTLDDLIERLQTMSDSVEAQMLAANSMGLLEILRSLIRRSLVVLQDSRYGLTPLLHQYLQK